MSALENDEDRLVVSEDLLERAPPTPLTPDEERRRRKLKVVSTKGSPTLRAFADLGRGLLQFRIWGMLGWNDIRQQYKRSTLGPLWLTLSMAFFVVFLGVLYAELFQRPLHIFMPHLTVGFIVWTLIATFIENGTRCFINAEGVIKQIYAPLSVHAYRLTWTSLLTLAHQVVIFVPVAFIFNVQPTTQWLLALPGFALLILTGVWVILLLGMISARFRDVPQVISSVMRVFFFLTPVIWIPEFRMSRAFFLTPNPFYHYIELVRGPILNKPIDPLHWQVAGAITLIGWIVTFIVYARFRGRVAYWL